MSEEVKLDEVEDVDQCLVGKVQSGKKMNRDAFKGLIEQIWYLFGHVEVELVGDNIFMFYFINREDRNRVWNRGPWRFGNSLIVLEKPVGSDNIHHLGFNKANFWIHIHDIPILCMNRRTSKWLAEQIGEVVEIPPELKLGKYDEITMVSLKYERLPEFWFAYGRIGHGIKECLDEEARKASIEGNGSVSLKSGSMASQKEVPISSVAATQDTVVKGINQVTLVQRKGSRPLHDYGPSKAIEMSTDE
ncbi:hypothetical protein EZV62_022231 [Acer yangbiense]|uniref:DUF4283 domain-containing protein n=1 Tax=Acer yangbiense TaxID=1000413 RepID=A0A5C7H954_9ROSI|nr:hypothetical protein EZV62_022231 [Acer yangbiense]